MSNPPSTRVTRAAFERPLELSGRPAARRPRSAAPRCSTSAPSRSTRGNPHAVGDAVALVVGQHRQPHHAGGRAAQPSRAWAGRGWCRAVPRSRMSTRMSPGRRSIAPRRWTRSRLEASAGPQAFGARRPVPRRPRAVRPPARSPRSPRRRAWSGCRARGSRRSAAPRAGSAPAAPAAAPASASATASAGDERRDAHRTRTVTPASL